MQKDMTLLFHPTTHTTGYGDAQIIAMQQSKITAVADSRTLTSAIYWTMNLSNPSNTIQEALATIQLPPGACVTRATLWVNGKAEEASFNGRELVQKAYPLTAAARRDPLLITSTKPGQIDLKAAPVLAYGSLQLSIGITAPMNVEDPLNCTVTLPYIISSNMKGADTEYHINSEQRLKTNSSQSLGPASFHYRKNQS